MTLLFDRISIVEEARSWVDVPWRHQGRTRLGIDCAGLVIVVAKALRLSTFDISNYRREPKRDQFIGHFRSNMREKQVVDRLPGDVLLIRDQMFTCHSAIVDREGEQEYMIHAFATRRKVVREPLTADWIDRCTHCFAYPECGD